MELIQVYAKVQVQDEYGDDVLADPPPDAPVFAEFSVMVAPNHDPQRIAVGRDSLPVKFDIYYRGSEPTHVDPSAHVVQVRGDRYEVDVKPAEWYEMAGGFVGDHFTVTTTIN